MKPFRAMVWVVCSTLPVATSAQSPAPPPAPAATAPAPPAVLTRDELRACMDQQSRISKRSESLRAELTRSNDEAAAIVAGSSALMRASANGFKDKASRDAHVARSSALERRASAHQAKLTQTQLAMADNQGSYAEYLRTCGAKSYFLADRDAILAEQAAAAKVPSSASSATSAASEPARP